MRSGCAPGPDPERKKAGRAMGPTGSVCCGCAAYGVAVGSRTGSGGAPRLSMMVMTRPRMLFSVVR